MNRKVEMESNALEVFPRLQVLPSNAASFADLDENPDLEVKTDIVDQLLASPRKKRAEVQYGKKTKLRIRTSSIKGSPTKLHNGSPSSDVVSDLTSLSSSTCSSSPGVTSPINNDMPKPPIRTPPNVVPLAACLGLTYGQLAEPAWSMNDLDSYVWVLLEPKSNRVYDPDRDKNDCKERLWWPAKIQGTRNTDVPLKVSLFGPGSKKVEIKTPSVENILSKLDMIGRLRFNKPTFISTSSIASHGPMTSPRKKLKRDRDDLEKQWEAAVCVMIQDEEEQAGSDHLPDIGEAFNYHFDATAFTTPVPAPAVVPMDMGKGKSKGKGKRKRSCDSDDEGFWEPPPPDEGLDIPGELVLGRERVSKTSVYWPAKIKSYIPPAKRTGQGKYTVIWLDGSEKNIPRDWFYTTDEDGFALCTLGKFESSVPEVLNDEDEDEDLLRRSASPVPLDSPPNHEDFSKLSIREQFVYTKTVLRAILNDEYEPSRSKHSRFMDGGKQRASLTEGAALRGRMDPKDVEHLQAYIREWCLRETPANISIVDEIENQSNHLGTIVDVQEEVKEPLLNLGLSVIPDRLRSLSPVLTEPVPTSSPQVPPSSSYPSVTLGYEASIASDNSLILPTVLESEAPSRSVATDSILGKTTPGSTDQPLQDVSARPAKQQGCEEYELLSQFDKIEYCLNVLLPEAVRQILLWRSGKRTSMQLLSSTEEEDLYQEGQTLLNETDWVFDILRYRQMKQRMLQSRIPKGKNGTTSRSRRGLSAPNYIE